MDTAGFKAARNALDTLFAVPDRNGGISLPDSRFFVLISGILDRMSGFSAAPEVARAAKCSDYLNALELEFGAERAENILL